MFLEICKGLKWIEEVKILSSKIFQECGLSIVCKINLTSVDFLDVSFDMKQETYTPYRKPNNNSTYIHKNSNHPQNILRDLPKSISKRISDTSVNEEIFNAHIPINEQALKNSGFNNNLTYRQLQHSNSHIREIQKKRKRKIIWFNPPFSTKVKTNIGKILFKLRHKRFPKTNQLYKIFSKNTIKISYSCTSNMGAIVSAHNQRLLTVNKSSFGCNCGNKSNCLLEQKCLIPKVIYQADVKDDVEDEYNFYYGLTETLFKERFGNHTKSFNHRRYQNGTELSKDI